MRVIQTEQHADALRDIVRGAKHTVEMISPYFGTEPVQEVMGLLREGVALTFTFAWPEHGSTPSSIAPAVLTQLLHAGHTVRAVHRSPQTLHGKVYVADDKHALVTSANLTSRGFGGLGASPRETANLELGILSSDREVVGQVLTWIEGLPAMDLTHADVQRLAEWSALVFEPPPEPPLPPLSKQPDHAAVLEVLSRAVEKGIVREFEHVPSGLGRAAFRVVVPGVRGYLTLRGRVSERSTDKEGPAYHFEIARRDQGRGGTDGYIFVPVDSRRHPVADVPTVIVPYDRIVGRKRHQLGLEFLSTAHARRVNLRVDSGHVTLRRPGTIESLDLLGCCNETSAFREFYR